MWSTTASTLGSAQVALLCVLILEADCTNAAGIIRGMDALMVADRPARIFEAPQQDLAAQQPDFALAATVWTPLHAALPLQQPDLAEVSLAATVFTPLHAALSLQQPDLAEVLLAATVWTPLHEALPLQQPDLAEVLLAAMVCAVALSPQADLPEQQPLLAVSLLAATVLTPLHEAFPLQHPDFAVLLLAATVFTPLHEAFSLQQPDLAEVLLAAMVWTPDLSEQEDFASQEFALATSELRTMRALGASHLASSPRGQHPSPEWFAATTAAVAFTPESQDPNMEHKDFPVTVA